MSAAAQSVSNSEMSSETTEVERTEDIIRLFYEAIATFRRKKPKGRAVEICRSLIRLGPGHKNPISPDLPVAWSDHLVASLYATAIPPRRRKKLGAYFTPPYVVDHLISRLRLCGMDPVAHRLRDAAAGGAAFLVPLARIKVAAWRQEGIKDREIVRRLSVHLIGREIEPDLAVIANALMRRMLIREFQVSPKLVFRLGLVKLGDSLESAAARKDLVDHEVGNPPFLRLRRGDKRLSNPLFDDITESRANLYCLFVRRALEEVPRGGLIGYVIPASFLGGPEFKRFRKRVSQLAEVLVLDLIEKRTDVFLDAIQDTCFIVLRRRQVAIEQPETCQAMSGTLRSDGSFFPKGVAQIHPGGLPWRLPGIEILASSTLKDWGYRATVGYLVPNRQAERLHVRQAKGRFPLIWAKAITPEGSFDFERGANFKGAGWVDAPDDARYVVRTACVAIQRTSSRNQKRRITAAAIPEKFIKRHGGIVAENHVILLTAIAPDAVPPDILAKALNRAGPSAELNRVCGSASISARLLETIELGPCPRRASLNRQASRMSIRATSRKNAR